MVNRIVLMCALLLSPVVAFATVTGTATNASFTCTGSVGPFPFTFPIDTAAAMTVVQNGAVLSSSAYSISPVNNSYDNGGSVTLNTACPSGQTLVLQRVTPITQLTQYTQNMAALYANIENGLDKLTEIDQEIEDNYQPANLIGTADPPVQSCPSTIVIGTIAISTTNHQYECQSGGWQLLGGGGGLTAPVLITQGGTGATTAAGANLNITGVTQTGTLGTSSQVSTFPGTVVTSISPQINALAYGVSTSNSDNSAAFNTWFAELVAVASANGGATGLLPPGTYNINPAAHLPTLTGATNVTILAYGAKLVNTAPSNLTNPGIAAISSSTPLTGTLSGSGTVSLSGNPEWSTGFNAAGCIGSTATGTVSGGAISSTSVTAAGFGCLSLPVQAVCVSGTATCTSPTTFIPGCASGLGTLACPAVLTFSSGVITLTGTPVANTHQPMIKIVDETNTWWHGGEFVGNADYTDTSQYANPASPSANIFFTGDPSGGRSNGGGVDWTIQTGIGLAGIDFTQTNNLTITNNTIIGPGSTVIPPLGNYNFAVWAQDWSDSGVNCETAGLSSYEYGAKITVNDIKLVGTGLQSGDCNMQDVISGNTLKNIVSQHAMYWDGGEDSVISGNTIVDAYDSCIKLNPSVALSHLLITGNSCRVQTAGYGVSSAILVITQTGRWTDVTISDNTINGNQGYGIDATNIDGLKISINKISNITGQGIFANSVTKAEISTNNIDTTSQVAIYATPYAGGRVDILNNIITNPNGTLSGNPNLDSAISLSPDVNATDAMTARVAGNTVVAGSGTPNFAVFMSGTGIGGTTITPTNDFGTLGVSDNRTWSAQPITGGGTGCTTAQCAMTQLEQKPENYLLQSGTFNSPATCNTTTTPWKCIEQFSASIPVVSTSAVVGPTGNAAQEVCLSLNGSTTTSAQSVLLQQITGQSNPHNSSLGLWYKLNPSPSGGCTNGANTTFYLANASGTPVAPKILLIPTSSWQYVDFSTTITATTDIWETYLFYGSTSGQVDILVDGAQMSYNGGVYAPTTTSAIDYTPYDYAPNGLVLGNTIVTTLPSPNVPPWLQYLGTGADGAVTCSGNPASIIYATTFNVAASTTCTVNSALGLTVHATGACTINGTITATPLSTSTGYGGGSSAGSGGGTLIGTAGSTSYPGPAATTYGGWGGGAAGAALGGTGANGVTPSAIQQRTVLASSPVDGQGLRGSVGPAGGSSGGAAADGGGGVTLICASITGIGTITANGANGNGATGNNTGAGAPGAGGVIILSSQAAETFGLTLSVVPGSPGTCGAYTGCGASGASGSGITAEFSGW